MANPTDVTSCGPGTLGNILPVSPFLGLFYHFGMLLGVDDFETGQAYHRGKMRLHNAWLHGQGVAWGFDVEIDAGKGTGEIRVKPGLAVDAAGRELHLDGTACLNIGAWVDAHKDELAFRTAAKAYDDTVELPVEGSSDPLDPIPQPVTFDAYVVIKFKGCLTRPVPAVSTTCAGSETETAFSRVSEIIDILLVPGQPPALPVTYHYLRLLFGLDDPIEDEPDVMNPVDADVVAKRDAILQLPLWEQPKAYLAAFKEWAAKDEVKLGPATKDGSTLLFPADDDTSIAIAKITAIKLNNGAWVSSGAVDISIRPVLVPTTVIQELLNGPMFGSKDAEGPRVTLAELLFTGTDVTGFKLTFSDDLEPGTIQIADNPTAFVVTWFDTTWHDVTITAAGFMGGDPKIVELTFGAITGWNRIRLIARGTGPKPILDTDLIPLAGMQNSAPGSIHDGHDYVAMFSPPTS